MAKETSQKQPSEATERVKQTASAEKQLLKEEAKAAKRVAKAQAQANEAETELVKASARFDRRRAELIEAEDQLRACQNARAVGPVNDSVQAEVAGQSTASDLVSDASALPSPA